MRIYFAGCEDIEDKTRAVHKADGKNVFVSYYNLTGSTNRAAQKQLLYIQKKLGIRACIDCGAYTFMTLHHKAKLGTAIVSDDTVGGNIANKGENHHALDIYLRDYISWLEENNSLITDFVELDMQRIVGIEPVKKWREIFRKRGLAHKMWMVHHSCDDWAHFERMIEESKIDNGGSGWCAIEGKNFRGNIDYVSAANHAYKHRVAIHAFASTRADFLTKVPLTSSDSTSWLQGTQYGTTVVYDPIRGGVLSAPYSASARMRGKNKVSVVSNAWTKLLASDVTNEERISAIENNLVEAVAAFKKMEDHLNQIWEEKGIFWNEVERENAEKKRKLYG